MLTILAVKKYDVEERVSDNQKAVWLRWTWILLDESRQSYSSTIYWSAGQLCFLVRAWLRGDKEGENLPTVQNTKSFDDDANLTVHKTKANKPYHYGNYIAGKYREIERAKTFQEITLINDHCSSIFKSLVVL